MPSVVCEWNPHPPEPRLAIADSNEWRERKELYSASTIVEAVIFITRTLRRRPIRPYAICWWVVDAQLMGE